MLAFMGKNIDMTHTAKNRDGNIFEEKKSNLREVFDNAKGRSCLGT
jgi:hypothetical protein